ncbi:hypothetical protein KZX50_00730 [Bacillus infantis]|uniref:hypothetical protein n=1 Tax=Bacillus infantis TaxID=324767 RepID=UPI002005D5A8|nr:hypothetical protein [Bacillus infantis]MCK6203973.1 hypothetical protein [Bacillus infantis]
MSVNKNEIMEFVSKAFDMGLRIEVVSYGNQCTKEEASKLSQELSAITGAPAGEIVSQQNHWFHVDHPNVKGCFFHKDSTPKNEDGYWLLFKDDEYVEDDLYLQDEENAG